MERRKFLCGLLGAYAAGVSGIARGDDEEKDIFFTASNYSGDKNGNKQMDLGEFDGMDKCVFGNDEAIGFGAIVRNREGKKLTFKLFDGSGKVIKEYGDIIPKSRWSLFYAFEPRELNAGEYIGIWKYGGFFQSEIRLKIEVKNISAKTLCDERKKRQMDDLEKALKEMREEYKAKIRKGEEKK